MIILFDGELNEVLGNVVIEQLLDVYTKNQAIMEANDRLKYKSDYLPLYCDEVEFRINSEGGDLFKFLEIWDIIERMKEEQGVIFKGRVSSHAYSAGFYLLCACDYRTVSRFASVMCHEMSLGNMMKLSDWSLEADRKAKTQQYLDDLVVKNTKITQEMLDSYKGRDFWMDYGDCVKYGIVKDELSEEEQLAKALEDMEKEDMTQTEFDAFVEEMKSYVNIIPDNEEEVEGESLDDEDEQEDNEIKEWEDIEEMKFNTAISTFMTMVNEFYKEKQINKAEFKTLLQILNPFAPHITEELFSKLSDTTIADTPWPTFDNSKTIDDEIQIPVQVNGKVKATVLISLDEDESSVKEKVHLNESVQKQLEDKTVVKEIYVKNKIYNIVVR